MTKKTKIAYQGIPGAYSYQAVEEFNKKFNLNFESVSCNNFRELFDTINKKTSLGIVPIENSIAGSVVQCYDLFLEYDVQIIGEFNFRIEHCLLSKSEKPSKIKKVYSHPQALEQCSNFLDKNNFQKIIYPDTAGAAKYISESSIEEGREIATIAGESAAKKYNLNILKKDIQNNKNNVTRFLIVKKKNKKFKFEDKLKPKNKSTVLFEADDVPAALYKCLGGFATNNINMLKIESRPSQKKNFDYIFYLDFEGNIKDQGVKNALRELNFFSKKVIFLGSYKKGKSI